MQGLPRWDGKGGRGRRTLRIIHFEGQRLKQQDIGWERGILAGSTAVTWPALGMEKETPKTCLCFGVVFVFPLLLHLPSLALSWLPAGR